ncbi:hypothetical protein OO014_16060 [Intrasporangium calvum]|uniref:Uncharacterized protein n=1 Tax=Intrasporangium calvum TaxID=53358 RepID=A0ABT5GLM5_9MICO|nr:hypothetical protein [Intrasporangium calvum]MDC5698770.1 hypothetical protein [Intrasporangium calvum]
MRLSLRRIAAASGIAVFALGSSATAAGADAPDFVLTLPAGVACAGFDLGIEGTYGTWHWRDFTDRNGEVIRTIGAGTGSALTFRNLSTDATVSFRSNGAVAQTTYADDGTMSVRMMGHNVLILFPTDNPPGPTSTLYIGQVTFTVDADEVATIQSTSGKEIDICAALS